MRIQIYGSMILSFGISLTSVAEPSETFKFLQAWTEFNKRNIALVFKTKEHARKYLNHEKKLLHTATRLLDIRGKLPDEIYDLCNFIQNSQDFINAGATPPKGILLVGPPGTGKTSIARAIAGELDVPFISASASSFIEVYIGTGPQSVRNLFEQAKEALNNTGSDHVIIFIDELDAIGSRTEYNAHSERKNTINELLVQMDGFSSDPRIIVLAATNNVDDIDEALKRRGRFDYIITIPLPDEVSRLEILTYYLTDARFNRSLANDVNLTYCAQKTSGFSGADLEGLAKDAAIQAGRNKRKTITQADLEIVLAKAIRAASNR